MLTQLEWQKIKAELKKNIEPVFIKANIYFPMSFDQIVDIFQIIVEKEIGDNDLDEREKICEALKIRYILKDGNLYSTILLSLSIKLESYFKRLFKIVGETLWINENNKLKGQIVTFVKKHKYNYADIDFASADDVLAFDNPNIKFFKSDRTNNDKPVYTPEDLRGAFPFSEQFKWAYDIANSQRHSDPAISEDDLPKLITNVISCYLFIALKYANRLSKELVHLPDINTISNWNIFKQYCNNFDKNQCYFLITDRLNVHSEQLANFVNIKWSFIFDLDIKSEVDGLFSVFNAFSLFPQVINVVTHTSDDGGRITATFPDNTSFWYFAQGNEGRQKSIVQSGLFADWRTMYGRYTQNLMIAYYEKKYSFIHYPIKVIILSKDKDKIKEIIYAIKEMNPKLQITFIFANEDNSQLIDLISEIQGKRLDLPTPHLLEGLREMEGIMFNTNGSDKIYLPCHSSKLGKSIELSLNDVNSIKQYFQIIHLNILQEISQPNDKSFYNGRSITWQELDNRFDVDRNITTDIVKAIRSSLESRVESAIFYLTHYAGAGGTTVAKRIAYEIHRHFPVLFLNETISSYGENELTEKLIKVFQATELPSLVVIDNSNITNQHIEMLERVVGNRLAKSVFLLVESTFSEPKKETNRFYIPATLDLKFEANRFASKFSEKFKEKDFQSILAENNHGTITPFYFGLIACENEYISLDKYVKIRIKDISAKEKDLLLLLAFCQIFGKGKLREVPHFVISQFLEVEEDYIRLRNHTQNHKIYDLIIETDDLCWKTIHPLIAERILKELIGTNDLGILNPFGLKDLAIKIIKSLRNISDNRNEQVLELLHNLFILRGEDDANSESEEADTDFSNSLYNKKLFSKLLNDLDNNNNRIEIFETLTSEFPDENAHFWGHFSRLHSINKDFSDALRKIEKALEIDNDFIFYHIKGMCYRTELYRIKDKCWDNKEEAKSLASGMNDYFSKASEAFEVVRTIAPKKEHGYIAFIQMVLQMIEFEYSISPLKTTSKDYTQFITSNTWCRNILIQANEVINDYNDYNQEYVSPKIREKQNQLLKFFGNKDKIINSWNGLLGNKDYDQNMVRRQLAYAYLAKNDFDWDKAKGKDIKRILELTEENLKNKVEIRDLKLWFEVARRLNSDIDELIKKVEIWEFQKPSVDTAYFLMCLYGIQAINGVKSGTDNYEKYQRKVTERITFTYSKVFCVEWVGFAEDKPILLNNKLVGKWNRNKQFFDDTPSNLFKLKGKVVKYLVPAQGFIEIEGAGVQVMYQPGKFNHFSDDAQKQTRVEFYLGFNYDGARAFDVKSL